LLDFVGFRIIISSKEKLMKKKKDHYIDNSKFYEEMVAWKNKVKEAEETDEPKPQISEYIARCFMQIGENLAKKPNFMNYPFKEDMISDGVENCLMYCSNFDPEKSTNPFSYFTQIIYYAFLRRIQKEKKQNYVKYKYLESLDKKGDFSEILKAMGISEEETLQYKNMEKSKTKNKKKVEE
jgi:DNA-directed RNA polymerase specialized sigma subunit